jgi:hypothetical protein
VTTDPSLPALPYSAWKQTKQTLHLYAQIVGKIKLATTLPRNHWWNIALHLDVRGLTTRRLTLEGTNFDLSFDFLDHRLSLRTDAGAVSLVRARGGPCRRGIRRETARAAS